MFSQTHPACGAFLDRMVVTARRTALFSLVAFVLGLASTARADQFVPMPANKGKANRQLKLRFVKYDGGTNGQMVVDIKNTSKTRQAFSADGLYFVPEGDPERAPQRLGASGPMLVMAGGKVAAKPTSKLMLAPGQTTRVRLEVFCIDSHRASPNRSTRFSIANTLLPKQLRRRLNTTNAAIYRKHRHNLPAAKAEVQSNMWKTRDAKWIKLQGERKHEKAAPSKRPHYQLRRPNPMEQQIR